MKMKRVNCIVIGGGGHARALVDTLLLMGIRPSGILDSDESLWGQSVYGVKILGGDLLLQSLTKRGVKQFVVGVGAVGDNSARKKIFEWGLSLGLKPLTVRHPTAICSTNAVVAPGAQLMAGSIVNAGATVEENVIVNSGAIVEHDCVISAHAHVATGAKLASGVRVGALAHIGAGAVVRQCLSIGFGAVVGAGAVVVKDVPAGVCVVGNPARALKKGIARA
jgi:UDP-perosamine 4-acetyltransferase